MIDELKKIWPIDWKMETDVIAKADIGKYRVRVKNEQDIYTWKIWRISKSQNVASGKNYPLKYAVHDAQYWFRCND